MYILHFVKVKLFLNQGTGMTLDWKCKGSVPVLMNRTDRHTRHFPVSGSQASLWLLQLQGTQGASRGRGPLPLSGSFPLW